MKSVSMSNPVSRRQVLSGICAASATAALAPALSGLANATTTAKAPFKLGIQIYSLRGFSVDKALQSAKDLGFEQVEFFNGMFSSDSTQEQIDAMLEKVHGLGLSISGYGVVGFGADAAQNRKLFEFAKKAKIKILTADPSPDSFPSLNELVKEFDIKIAIHNHGPSHHYNKAVDVLRAIEKQDERIGACADLGHFIRSGEQPVEVIRTLQGRLYGIHLKDFAEMKENTTGVILGKGHLNCQEVFDALVRANFPADGALSLEYEENPENPIEDIRQCVAIAKKAMATL